MNGKCAFPGSTDPGKCCSCEAYKEDVPCAKCAASVRGCVTACVELCREASAEHVAGMCRYGDDAGGTFAGLCCECFP